jgi:AcrR family transcriptional regulator
MPDRHRTIRGSARKAILWATLEIVASQGIDAVTHRRVAERAGVSPGSTTHHFASREELLRETFRFYLEHGNRLLSTIEAENQASVADPLERVRRFATEIIRREFIEPGARFIRAEHEMLLFASTDDELRSYVRAWEARWVASIAGDLEAAGWPQPVEAARTLINLIRGYELERLLDPQADAADFGRRLDSVLTRTDSG